MRFPNPFTPSFGQVPPFMAGREQIIAEILRGFENGPGDPNLSTIFTGARGTGKTALLSYLSQEVSSRGWVTADVSASPGMLEDIIERGSAAASEFLEKEDKRRLKGIKIGTLSLDWEYRDPSSGNWRTRMNALFGQLNHYDVGLLITIDEVDVRLEEMVLFASVYQHFVREGRKVALLMAGLPYKISSLLRNDSISFLRRAQCHRLGRIEDHEVEAALVKTVGQGGRELALDARSEALVAIDGFPYMMQLVGYRMWEINPDNRLITLEDVREGANLAKREIEDRILATTYYELSDGDIRFLAAMLPDCNVSRVAEVAKRMGVASNYASQYKRRLLEGGIIGERGRGIVGFDIPGFKDYLRAQLEAEGSYNQ